MNPYLGTGEKKEHDDGFQMVYGNDNVGDQHNESNYQNLCKALNLKQENELLRMQ